MTATQTKIREAAKAHVDAYMNHVRSLSLNSSYVIGNDSGEVVYRRIYAPRADNAYLAPIQMAGGYFKTTSLERATNMLERIKADNPVGAQCRLTTEADAFRCRIDLLIAAGADAE